MTEFDGLTRIDDSNYARFITAPKTEDGGPECLPRRFACGSPEAAAAGLKPISSYLDKMVPEDEWKERIAEAHTQKTFPYYHSKRHSQPAKNQNGYGYCWAYGITSCLEQVRVMQGQPFVELCPNSLGWLVNWRNRGYYPSEAIQGTTEKGVCSMEFGRYDSINPRHFKAGWEEDCANYRTAEWFDCHRNTEREMLRQVVSLLLAGCPCYIAHNWWSHALMIDAIQWNERSLYNIDLVHLNSHGDGHIILSGHKGIPDECYGLSSVTVAG